MLFGMEYFNTQGLCVNRGNLAIAHKISLKEDKKNG